MADFAVLSLCVRAWNSQVPKQIVSSPTFGLSKTKQHRRGGRIMKREILVMALVFLFVGCPLLIQPQDGLCADPIVIGVPTWL